MISAMSPATEPPPELREPLELLDRAFGLDALWVFGSEASGRARPDSDLDLAALFRRRPAAIDLLDAAERASAKLGRKIDLVDLDQVTPILATQVLRHGRLIVDRDPARRHRFEATVPARREDLLIVRRPIEERLIARFVGEAAGGG